MQWLFKENLTINSSSLYSFSADEETMRSEKQARLNVIEKEQRAKAMKGIAEGKCDK